MDDLLRRRQVASRRRSVRQRDACWPVRWIESAGSTEAVRVASQESQAARFRKVADSSCPSSWKCLLRIPLHWRQNFQIANEHNQPKLSLSLRERVPRSGG